MDDVEQFTKKSWSEATLLLAAAFVKIVFMLALEAALWFIGAALIVAPFAWLFGAVDVRGVAIGAGWIGAAISVPVNIGLTWSKINDALYRQRLRRVGK